MIVQTLDLEPFTPGQQQRLRVLRFGPPAAAADGGEARPKATIQAALHADEVPAILVAHALREKLLALEEAGALRGEVVLVPYANPLGLAQQFLGQHQGRFSLADGRNFNRGYPELGSAVAERVAGRLGDDAAHNASLIRAALREAALQAQAEAVKAPEQDLKRKLLALAIDSDIVLDLHCDSQAVMHLYALTPQADSAAELGALLGARAILLATESGDSPFDEACSRPWFDVQQRFAGKPVPLGCFCATVELRGEADTQHELAQRDAAAIVEFLRRRGLVDGPAAELPPVQCDATPLSASESIVAPKAGVVVFRAEPGAQVRAGDVVADIVDADSGEALPLRALSAGVLYARVSTRWATPGRSLAKIAGTALKRSGNLLSP